MNKNNALKALIGIILSAGLLLVTPAGNVQAADFSHDSEVGADEMIADDVFLSGEYCQMNGSVDGNLIAGCQEIIVSGTVTGDVFLFAETINVENSTVINGNLFAFGANVTVDGTVDGSFASAAATIELGEHANVMRNVYFAGFQGKMDDGASVGMDLFGGANQIVINGDIVRDLTVGVNAFELRGNIGRNAKVELGTESADVSTYYSYTPGRQYFPASLPSGMRFYEGAKIGNDLTYQSTQNMGSQIEDYVGGTVVYQEIVESTETVSRTGVSRGLTQQNLVRTRVTQSFSRLITIYALGALAFWLFKKQSIEIRARGYAAPGKAFGWGFVAILVGLMGLILIPGTFILIGILLGVISLGGLLFAWYGVIGAALVLVFVLFLFVVFTLSKVVAAYTFGYWLMKDVFKAKTQNRWIDLLVGVLFYVILRAIPYVGWAIGLAASLYGTGTIFMRITNVDKKKVVEKVEAEQS